ncbi:MAG: methyltransferase [Bacteroidetes bacterium CHB5]|nr:methyltransferase [Bacteroidetes bacterium CHB5]
MDSTESYSLSNKTLSRRYTKTLAFVKQTLPGGSKVLDIGITNPLSKLFEQAGYTIVNTKGEDLDIYPESVREFNTETAFAFEILEHLINPMGVLKNLQAKRLYASIPLSLWFAKAYRNKNDRWDQHFHEFEDWQFDWLLEKSGWQIVRSEKWTSPTGVFGFRPLLRYITPRYYIIEAKR